MHLSSYLKGGKWVDIVPKSNSDGTPRWSQGLFSDSDQANFRSNYLGQKKDAIFLYNGIAEEHLTKT